MEAIGDMMVTALLGLAALAGWILMLRFALRAGDEFLTLTARLSIYSISAILIITAAGAFA